MNIKSIEKELKIIWDYMVLDEDFPKCDLIIGCGCQSLTIPITCANLYKQGYADKIIFAGGLGKITKYHFKKAEAEMYKEIAIQEGVPEEKIWIENKSTNTGDNFRFSKKIIDEENWNIKNILIVHNKFSERRTLSAAKAIIKDKECIFPKGYNYEDNVFWMMYSPWVKTGYYIDKPFYNYFQRAGSIIYTDKEPFKYINLIPIIFEYYKKQNLLDKCGDDLYKRFKDYLKMDFNDALKKE